MIIGSKYQQLPDAGKDQRQEEKETTEDEMVGWHHWFNGHESEQAPGDGEGKPGMLQSMWSQRVRHDWVTELNIIKDKHSHYIMIERGSVHLENMIYLSCILLIK